MKPVAWMRRQGEKIIRITPEPVWDTDEPLYTAPRDLSDEEIKTLHDETSWWGVTDPVKFAKAILKKASEK
jgi:hypothetical protein